MANFLTESCILIPPRYIFVMISPVKTRDKREFRKSFTSWKTKPSLHCLLLHSPSIKELIIFQCGTLQFEEKLDLDYIEQQENTEFPGCINKRRKYLETLKPKCGCFSHFYCDKDIDKYLSVLYLRKYIAQGASVFPTVLYAGISTFTRVKCS